MTVTCALAIVLLSITCGLFTRQAAVGFLVATVFSMAYAVMALIAYRNASKEEYGQG